MVSPMRSNQESIVKKVGQNPGPIVAVFAGVHGNERAGIMAMEKVLDEVRIENGTAYFIFANPEAIARNTRFVEKNLNRLFTVKNTVGQTAEEKRARELMLILDQCDALLDLHGYNSTEDEPFIITDKEGLDMAAQLDFKHIVMGISKVGEGGTDCYMTTKGKSGLCLECGSNFRPEQYVPLAEKSIYQFLQFYGLVKKRVPFSSVKQTYFAVEEIVIRQTDDFTFTKPYRSFDKLEPGQVYARDGGKEYVAHDNQYIIFPRPDQVIGQEAFMLIRQINNPKLGV